MGVAPKVAARRKKGGEKGFGRKFWGERGVSFKKGGKKLSAFAKE